MGVGGILSWALRVHTRLVGPGPPQGCLSEGSVGEDGPGPAGHRLFGVLTYCVRARLEDGSARRRGWGGDLGQR